MHTSAPLRVTATVVSFVYSVYADHDSEKQNYLRTLLTVGK